MEQRVSFLETLCSQAGETSQYCLMKLKETNGMLNQ